MVEKRALQAQAISSSFGSERPDPPPLMSPPCPDRESMITSSRWSCDILQNCRDEGTALDPRQVLRMESGDCDHRTFSICRRAIRPYRR